MPQETYNIANDSGANVRTDLNNHLAAIVQANSGATTPSTTFAHQLWADTSPSGYSIFQVRNAANAVWATCFDDEGRWKGQLGNAAEPSMSFGADTDTGFYRSASNEISLTTGGTLALTVDSSQNTTLVGTLAVGGPITAQVDGGAASTITSIFENTGSGNSISQIEIKSVDSDWKLAAVSATVIDQFQIIDVSTGNKVFQIDKGTPQGAFVIQSNAVNMLRPLTVTFGTAGSDNSINIFHTNNTNTSSDARIHIRSGGSSGGDPYILFEVDSVPGYVMGIDNSDSDKLVISRGSAIGTTNVMEVDTSGDVTWAGAVSHTPVTITTDTTPTAVGRRNIIIGAWTAANNITDFDNETAGQRLTILGGDSDCNIVDGSGIELVGGTLWNAAAGATLELVSNGTDWVELSRSAT